MDEKRGHVVVPIGLDYSATIVFDRRTVYLKDQRDSYVPYFAEVHDLSDEMMQAMQDRPWLLQQELSEALANCQYNRATQHNEWAVYVAAIFAMLERAR
jgi:prefoldin subunit 5